MNLPQLRTPEVRDLAWACFSEPLLRTEALSGDSADIANCALSLTARRRDWLAALDACPDPLLAHLQAGRSNRLGIYFERLWQFFLTEDPTVDLIAHNLPVREGGRTLGEFDILYYCHERQRQLHLELAVKFYLGYPGAPDTAAHSHWRQWLGPASRDRLDLKIDHLVDRQIRLSDRSAATQVLQELGITAPLSREIEIKGYLFAPGHGGLAPPYAHNDARKMHHWYFLDDLPGALERDARYIILERAAWLAPAHIDSASLNAATLDSVTLGPAGLLDALQSPGARLPCLVACLGTRGLERQRFFVVDDNWPQHGHQGQAASQS